MADASSPLASVFLLIYRQLDLFSISPKSSQRVTFYAFQNSFLIVSVVAAISGCASVSHTVADKNDLAGLAGQPITYSVGDPSSFLLSTPENNRVALMRVAVWIKEGGQIIDENKVSDPAVKIAIGIARRLEQAYGARWVGPLPADSKVAAVPGAKFVIEVKTTNWGLFYSGADNTQHGLAYSATVQLIDPQKGRVIASGYCKPNSSPLKTYTRDQLLTNSATGLKTGLSGVADDCIKFISTQILTMQGADNCTPQTSSSRFVWPAA